MTRPATDTEIVAHIEANSTPAAMLTLHCGDFALARGVFAVGETFECDDCGQVTLINGVIETAIVGGL